MPAIDQTRMADFVQVGLNGITTAESGKALEDLVCYLFDLVPGVSITHRNELNAFDTEEIDVAVWNDGDPDGLSFLPNIILIECKNWSARVGSSEVNWFDSKLRSRGLDFGILIAARGITGHSADLTAAHSIVASALKDRRRFLVITTDELLALPDTGSLAHLIKKKLCDLAVKGTIG
jgi:hypothetical protein